MTCELSNGTFCDNIIDIDGCNTFRCVADMPFGDTCAGQHGNEIIKSEIAIGFLPYYL